MEFFLFCDVAGGEVTSVFSGVNPIRTSMDCSGQRDKLPSE